MTGGRVRVLKARAWRAVRGGAGPAARAAPSAVPGLGGERIERGTWERARCRPAHVRRAAPGLPRRRRDCHVARLQVRTALPVCALSLCTHSHCVHNLNVRTLSLCAHSHCAQSCGRSAVQMRLQVRIFPARGPASRGPASMSQASRATALKAGLLWRLCSGRGVQSAERSSSSHAYRSAL